MRTFTDNAGRTWTVQIHVDAIKRVRALAKVNLLEVVSGPLLEQLFSDSLLLCDVVYSLCKPQADAQNITEEDFDKAMAGDAVAAATAALLEELVAFFPEPRRSALAKAITKLRKLETAAMEAVKARLDSPELERLMDEQLTELATPPTSPRN